MMNVVINWPFHRRKVKGFTQCPDKRLVVADSFPGLSESFATGLPLHSTSFITMFSGLTCGMSQVKRVPMPKLRLTREEKWR